LDNFLLQLILESGRVFTPGANKNGPSLTATGRFI
jgi:hypothetical protein